MLAVPPPPPSPPRSGLSLTAAAALARLPQGVAGLRRWGSCRRNCGCRHLGALPPPALRARPFAATTAAEGAWQKSRSPPGSFRASFLPSPPPPHLRLLLLFLLLFQAPRCREEAPGGDREVLTAGCGAGRARLVRGVWNPASLSAKERRSASLPALGLSESLRVVAVPVENNPKCARAQPAPSAAGDERNAAAVPAAPGLCSARCSASS